MDNFIHWVRSVPIEPIQVVYGVIAMCGGIARYLNSYVRGEGFSWRVFVASSFVAGFSGVMFADLGTTMNLPLTFIYMMAGTGGFFGDQTMKFVMEYLKGKAV